MGSRTLCLGGVGSRLGEFQLRFFSTNLTSPLQFADLCNRNPVFFLEQPQILFKPGLTRSVTVWPGARRRGWGAAKNPTVPDSETATALWLPNDHDWPRQSLSDSDAAPSRTRTRTRRALPLAA
eukprot:1691600-Rhodomonas_salina.1